MSAPGTSPASRSRPPMDFPTGRQNQCCRKHGWRRRAEGRRSLSLRWPASFGVIAELAQQRAAEVVIVDLNKVARRGAKPLAPLAHFPGRSRGDVARTLERARDLKRRDPGLKIGEPPDAADRLKEADEEQVRDLW